MSDYKPITGELRKYAGIDRGVCYMDQDSFDRLCDTIDAIHAGLERENAELRAARGDDWIKLPKDADGKVWSVGDEIVDDGMVCEVVGIGPNRLYYYVDATDTVEWTQADSRRHHHAPTVEDVLREFALKVAGEECMTMRTGVVEEYAAKLRLARSDAS